MALVEEDRCGTDGQSEKVAVPVVIMKMNVLLLYVTTGGICDNAVMNSDLCCCKAKREFLSN